jgi:hypothetical protein
MADDKAREPTFRYEDVPELAEVFADSIGQLYFDGNTLRLELLISRLDEARDRGTGTAPTGRRRPVSRLVLSATAAVDMINRCRQLSAALEQAGVLKKSAVPGQAPN